LSDSFSFDLIKQPWIPCLTASGQAEELSLRETLARAPEIREVVDPSPLVTAALHRLLIAIVHRCLGPNTDEEWQHLWERGSFDLDVVGTYLAKWRHRLNLFDSERPFYQTPELDRSKAAPVSKLAHELSSGNNALLFDHSVDAEPQPIAPARAARYLVALHAFAVGGLVSFQKGEEKHRSAAAAPLTKGAVVFVAGANLFETITLNMVNVDGTSSAPFEFDPVGDAPAWEQAERIRPADRSPSGYIDLLTWQSRRVLLLPEVRNNALVVPKVVLMKGYQLPDSMDQHSKETMLAFQKREKTPSGQDPWPPMGFRPERVLWRDSLVLLQKSDDRHQRPRTVEELANRDLGTGHPASLVAFGMSSDRAKVMLWRHDRLPLPTEYLRDTDLMSQLASAIKLAEDAAARLGSAVRLLAQKTLFPAGNPERKRVSSLVNSLAAERPYWAALNGPFRRLMVELADAWALDEQDAPIGAWAAAVRDAATDAFEAAARSLETSARGLRAAAEARGGLRATLHVIIAPFLP